MSDLLSHLMQFAYEERFEYYLAPRHVEYNKSQKTAEEALAQLRARLDQPESAVLERYLDSVELSRSIEEKTLFQCGLSMGIELVHPETQEKSRE